MTVASIPEAVADTVHHTEYHQQDNQQNSNRHGRGDHASGTGSTVCVCIAHQQVNPAEERLHSLVILPGLDILIEIGVHIAGRLRGKQIIEPAAGHQVVVSGTGIQHQYGVVFSQLEAASPVPGQVLRGFRAVGLYRHHRQDAASHLVPIGIVQTHCILCFGGKNVRLVHHILLKYGSAQRFIQLFAALRHRHIRPLIDTIGRG